MSYKALPLHLYTRINLKSGNNLVLVVIKQQSVFISKIGKNGCLLSILKPSNKKILLLANKTRPNFRYFNLSTCQVQSCFQIIRLYILPILDSLNFSFIYHTKVAIIEIYCSLLKAHSLQSLDLSSNNLGKGLSNMDSLRSLRKLYLLECELTGLPSR